MLLNCHLGVALYLVPYPLWESSFEFSTLFRIQISRSTATNLNLGQEICLRILQMQKFIK